MLSRNTGHHPGKLASSPGLPDAFWKGGMGIKGDRNMSGGNDEAAGTAQEKTSEWGRVENCKLS